MNVFGVHFASLDIRQESSEDRRVLEAIGEKENRLSNYDALPDAEKISFLSAIDFTVNPEAVDDVSKETLLSIDSIKEIQRVNGEKGCYRYIISQCGTVLNVMEVYALFLLRGWKKEDIHVDIVPLFETIEDFRSHRAAE